jgi:hypothetical protein
LIRAAAAVCAGAWAVLRVPLWLRGGRLPALLAPPPNARPEAEAPPAAVRAALVGVRVLGSVPGLPWRRTCLYRSVAECLALRRYGVPAVVRIGVRHAGEAEAEAGSGPVKAHAWVVRLEPGRDEPEPPDAMRPLSLRASAAAGAPTRTG